jgi:hypothetical protein
MRIRLHAVAVVAAASLLPGGQQTIVGTGVAHAAILQGAPARGVARDHSLRVAAEADVDLAASDNGPVTLGAGATRVRLLPPSTAGPLSQRIRTLPPTRQVYLILQGINTNVSPGITYNVYLGRRDAAHFSGATDPNYVGTFSFFDAGPSRDAVFNVTGKVRKLDEAGALDDQPTVTVVPAGTPESGAKPTVAKVRLVAAEP